MKVLKKDKKNDLISNDENIQNDNKKQLIIKDNKSTKNKERKNKGRLLVNSIVTALLVIILIDIYILANIVLEKVTLPEFDFTENKVYTLSEETKSKLKNLQKEVTITFINFDDNDSILKVAERYIILNNNIKIERINDIASRKDLMEKYSLDTQSQLIIISSGENETQISDYDLYTYDYSTYETIDTSEEAFTNAIVNVTTEEKPKIYFMNNHVAYNLEYYFYIIMDLMRGDANEVNTLDILTVGSVPEDCDTLVITTLSEDITILEKEKILEYINKGGEILLLNGPNVTGKQLTNFQEILNQYGVTVENGIVFEGESANMLYQFPDFIVEKMQSSSITKNLNMDSGVGFLGAASIKFNKERQEELNVEYEELVTTSDKAFLRTNLEITTNERTDLDSKEGEFLIGGIVNKKIDDNNNSKLIIFGNELFATNMTLEEIIGGTTDGSAQTYIVGLYHNADVILNSIAYLNEREDTITIRKDYDSVSYTPTELQHNIIMAIIFIVPLVIIIAGIIVWQIRRRRK